MRSQIAPSSARAGQNRHQKGLRVVDSESEKGIGVGNRPSIFGRALQVPGSTIAALVVSAGVLAALQAGPATGWITEVCGRQGVPMFSTTTGGAGASIRPATVVSPLSCVPLPDVPGRNMTTALVQFSPGAYSGPHRHPGSVSAYVVSGSIRSQMAGSAANTFKAGEAWFEPPRALHLFAENASASEPATLLAIFVADEDCGPLVIPEPNDE